MHMWVNLYMDSCRGLQRASGPLELESQVFVSHRMGVLGAKLTAGSAQLLSHLSILTGCSQLLRA